MKRARPFKTRLRNAFMAVAGATMLGGTGVFTELLPKDPDTDTQIVMNRDTPEQYGINISIIDQIWKHTLGMRSEESQAQQLITAAKMADSWRVDAILQQQEVNLSNEGVIALSYAAALGHADVVDVLLKKGVPVNGLDDLPFISAMNSARYEFATTFMQMARPGDAHIQEALNIAARDGALPMLEKMIDAGASITAQDDVALVAAAQNGQTAIIERLFAEKVTYKTYETIRVYLPPPFIGFEDGIGPRDIPEWNGRFSDYPAYSRTYRNDVQYDEYNQPFKYHTTETEHIKTAVNPQAQDNLPLQLAAQGGHVEAMKVLIKNGANINDPQVMLNAVKGGNVETIKFILSVSPMMVDAQDGAPLYEAVKNGDFFMAQTLMRAGANPDAGNGRIWQATEKTQTAVLMQNVLKGNNLFFTPLVKKGFPGKPSL